MTIHLWGYRESDKTWYYADWSDNRISDVRASFVQEVLTPKSKEHYLAFCSSKGYLPLPDRAFI